MNCSKTMKVNCRRVLILVVVVFLIGFAMGSLVGCAVNANNKATTTESEQMIFFKDEVQENRTILETSSKKVNPTEQVEATVDHELLGT